jgi:hypothetical protein
MMPPHSWSVPGWNPGTSMNVTIGTLNASHVLMKRAAFSELVTLSEPARIFGWLATIPTLWPPRRAKPQMMFGAKYGKYS